MVIETLGCKLNLADSDRLAERFAAAGFALAPPAGAADIYVLNTCTVTHIADSKARQMLRAARRRLPGALIVATGCFAQRDPAGAALPGVDLVAGNDRKSDLVALVSAALEGRPPTATEAPPTSLLLEPPPPPVSDAPGSASVPSGRGGRRAALTPTRAFVAIQQGCNDVCAFCIVPRVRGRSRSVPESEILDAVQRAVAASVREVVLTGTQLGDYGQEAPRPRRPETASAPEGGLLLAGLLRRVLAETEVERLRVSSVQPQDISPALLAVWADTRMCRHLHLALQSGSDRVLAAMRRRYDAAGFLTAVEAVRRSVPGAAITTDVIAGFPGETEEEFAQTLEVCRRAGFAAIHVFPFSPRTGAAAARLPGGVPDALRRERSARLRALGDELSARRRTALLGSRATVLWERPTRDADGPLATGLTDTHDRVYAAPGTGRQGDFTEVRVTRPYRDGVWGEPAEPALSLPFLRNACPSPNSGGGGTEV